MSQQLSGKTVIITGAAGGLGRAFALGFAERGANVVVADMNEAGSAETVALIEAAGGKAIAVQTNVTDKASCEAVADAAVATFGSLDVLVNNAAIYATIERANFWEIDPNEWDKVMAVNVKGAWLASGAAFTRMNEGGSIINIASAAGLRTLPPCQRKPTSRNVKRSASAVKSQVTVPPGCTAAFAVVPPVFAPYTPAVASVLIELAQRLTEAGNQLLVLTGGGPPLVPVAQYSRLASMPGTVG